jgi:hypothetical protein
MLYEIDGELTTIKPLSYYDFSDERRLERDLENLISNHLLDVLFEHESLMPIFQERQGQSRADIYALDAAGNLCIFELKRSEAPETVVLQLLGYAQEAAHWTYSTIQDFWRQHTGEKSGMLRATHQAAFELEEPLPEDQFNAQQHLRVIASAAEDSVIRNVQFWKRQGVDIDFLPYRLYRLGEQRYFEFFSKPFDIHTNPRLSKGIMIDTFNPESLHDMISASKISAYGSTQFVTRSLKRGDIVFFYHAGAGIVAVGEVTGAPQNAPASDETYCKVRFLTATPTDFAHPAAAIPASRIKHVVGHDFYWAHTAKKPALTLSEARALLDEALRVLGPAPNARAATGSTD